MRYPKLCNWVLTKKHRDGSYTFQDCYKNNSYTLGSAVGYFAKQLDGKTDPFCILPDYSRREVRQMLDDLGREGLIRYGRVLDKSKSSISYSLIIPRKHRSKSILPKLFNYLLLSLWLPIFLWGLWCFCTLLPDIDNGSSLLGQLAGILAGAVLHEASHAAAGYCYGARIFEAGVMIHNYLPGAYVMMDCSPVKKRLQRVQIYAAGVQMNMLLSGAALLLCAYNPGQSGFFFGFSLVNLLLALLNLTFTDGLDGTAMLSELLGAESIVLLAKYTLTQKEERQRVLRAGIHGAVELTVCGVLVLLQAVMPSIYLMYLLEVIECFV